MKTRKIAMILFLVLAVLGQSAVMIPVHAESITQQPEPAEFTVPADLSDPLAVQSAEEVVEIPESSGEPGQTELSVPADLPDTLTVKTGFSDAGPDEYQEVRSFGLSELEALDLYLTDYTFLDENGRLFVVRAQGFLLTDLLREAGIEIEDVSFLHFLFSTPEGDRTVSFSKEELLDTTRLCNYSLVNCYEEETGTLTEHRRWMAAETDVMIALQDSWILASEGGSFEEDGEELLVPRNRFRLIFGQTDCLERDAERAVGGIHTILAQYAGEAPEEMDTTGLSGEEADPGLPEAGSVHEEPENGDDQGNGGSPSGAEETNPELPEEGPLTLVEFPEEKPGQHLTGTLTARLRTVSSAPEADTKKNISHPAGNYADREPDKPLSEMSSDNLQKETADPVEKENSALPETADDAEEANHMISVDRQKEGNLLLKEEVEATVQEKTDPGEEQPETQEIPELPEIIPLPAGSHQEIRPYTAATSVRSDTTIHEPVGQNGFTFEKFPVSTTSENPGKTATEKMKAEEWKIKAVEEYTEEEQSAASTAPQTSVEDPPQTELQRLIPITILNADVDEPVNPLFRPVGWLAVIIFLLGGLMEYIRYYREMGNLSRERKERFSVRRLKKAEARLLSESDEQEAWMTESGRFPFIGSHRELSEAEMR